MFVGKVKQIKRTSAVAQGRNRCDSSKSPRIQRRDAQSTGTRGFDETHVPNAAKPLLESPMRAHVGPYKGGRPGRADVHQQAFRPLVHIILVGTLSIVSPRHCRKTKAVKAFGNQTLNCPCIALFVAFLGPCYSQGHIILSASTYGAHVVFSYVKVAKDFV
jgi:hypothetical protein